MTEVSPRFNVKTDVPADAERQLSSRRPVRPVQPEGPHGPVPGVRGRRTTPDDRPGLARVHLERAVPQGLRLVHVPRGEVHRVLGLLRPEPDQTRRRRTTTVRPAPTRAARGYVAQYDRTRNQVNVVAVEVRADGGLAQLQVRRRNRAQHDPRPVRTTWTAERRPFFYYDYGGAPYLRLRLHLRPAGQEQARVVLRAGPVEDRPLTANLGVRLDNIRGRGRPRPATSCTRPSRSARGSARPGT